MGACGLPVAGSGPAEQQKAEAERVGRRTGRVFIVGA